MTSVVGLQDEVFRKKLRELVVRYTRNRENYIARNSDYTEMEVRTDYIDELFKALNWDINNLRGLPPFAQEVRRERGPTVGEPDYTFRLSSGETSANPVFFVEAKAPKESLDNKSHIFQAKSYAFSAAQSSLVLVILTNFERFRIYSVHSEPNINDSVEKELAFDWAFNELEAKISELMIFEKHSVLNGSLSKLAREGVPVKMRPPVEVPFLNRLDNYRERLARGFFSENRELSEIQLNLLTDTILNRIVFIRFAEDRNIIPPESLKQVLAEWEHNRDNSLFVYLKKYFAHLNQRFNGRMFADEADNMDCKIDDILLKEVIENFYSPVCPYRFDHIKVELLGEIYEKYLAKVIVRRGRGIVIEERPEVRHAKGVYYTPSYIVDEILRSCLLPKLEATRAIEEIFELRGIDPACGSGTFLLGAYRIISSFIFKRALESEESRERYLEVVNDNLKIKYGVKRNILEYCLNGIDIDARAIRVSELSLYLKLLEEEPDIARNPMPYLPSLDRNLQMGNSLIDSSMLPQLELDMEDKILNRISPFTWETNETFGPIMNNGGFDWVMGNPPYIRMQILRKFSSKETDIIQRYYSELKKGNPDIYVAFLLRGLDKLKKGGSLGFIVSNKFAITEYGKPLRKRLTSEFDVKYYVDFGHEQVFDGATTHTCIITVDKVIPKGQTVVKTIDVKPGPNIFQESASGVSEFKSDLRKLKDLPWNFHAGRVEVLSGAHKKLGDICEIFQGIRTSDNDVFVLRKVSINKRLVKGYSKALKGYVEIEEEICRPFLAGREIGRNFHSVIKQALIFPYQKDNAYKLIPFAKIERDYPKAASYLKKCRQRLKEREDGDFDQRNWYGYIYLKNHDLFSEPKVMVQEMAPRAHLTLDPTGTKFFVTGYGLYFKNKSLRTIQHYRFVQSLIKSKRLDSKIVAVASKVKAGYQYRKQYLKDLPIPVFNQNNQHHLAVVDLQEQIEGLGVRVLNASDAAMKREFLAQIDTLERDQEVIIQVIYDGIKATSADIIKVEKIVTRIEDAIAEARKKSSVKVRKSKNA